MTGVLSLMDDVRLNFKKNNTGHSLSKKDPLPVKDVWGTFFDLWFLIPILSLMVGSEVGGGVRLLGDDFLYMGVAWLVSAFLFRTPLPLQPLKIWAFLFLLLRPTPAVLSLSAVLQGVVFCWAGYLSRSRRHDNPFDRSAFERVRRAVSLYVRGIAILALGGILFQSAGIPFPAHWISGFSDLNNQSTGTVLAALLLVIPQIPVTLVNGALSTVREWREEGGVHAKAARRLTGRNILLWLGCANLAAAALGVLPFCHGSGGLRTYRRFRIGSLLPSFISGVLLILLGLACRMPGASLPPRVVSLFFLGMYLVVEAVQEKRGKDFRAGGGDRRTGQHVFEIWIVSGGMLSGGLILGIVPFVLVLLPVLGGVRSLAGGANPVNPAKTCHLKRFSGEVPSSFLGPVLFLPTSRRLPDCLRGGAVSSEEEKMPDGRKSPPASFPDPVTDPPDGNVLERIRRLPERMFLRVILLFFCVTIRPPASLVRKEVVCLSFPSRCCFSSLVPARAP